MKRFHKIPTILITAALILCLAIPALAIGRTVNLEASYRDIIVSIDGVKIVPKDVLGNTVEPFLYNGTVYAPYRALAEALGYVVSWDGDTSTVSVDSPWRAPLTTDQLGYEPTPADLRPASEMELVESAFGSNIPVSTELPEGVKAVRLPEREAKTTTISFFPNVVYDTKDGMDLLLQIMVPAEPGGGPLIPSIDVCPLIIYIPGSAWSSQYVYTNLPLMIRLAEQGYVVAIAQYRPMEVAEFPAQIEDARTAVRFMRKNAEEYRVDTNRIILMGDSSGAHTALMAAITGDGTFDNGTYKELSSNVNCVIDWCAPTDLDLFNYYPSWLEVGDAEGIGGTLLGGADMHENPDLALTASPMTYITDDNKIPPILIMHGSADNIVPFNQSVRLFEKLKETNKDVEMYKIEGGMHGVGGGFTSDASIDLMLDYINRKAG